MLPDQVHNVSIIMLFIHIMTRKFLIPSICMTITFKTFLIENLALPGSNVHYNPWEPLQLAQMLLPERIKIVRSEGGGLLQAQKEPDL